MQVLRFISAAKLDCWRAAGIQVTVVFTAPNGLHAVRVQPGVRGGDLP